MDSFSGAIHPSQMQQTTIRYIVLSKCPCSPPYIGTHTHAYIYRESERERENGKDTKLFVVQRTCPCKIRTEKFSAPSHFSCHKTHNQHIDKALPKLYGLTYEIFAASSTIIRFYKTDVNFETIINQIGPTQMIELECQISI
jgi:hypothetical protein